MVNLIGFGEIQSTHIYLVSFDFQCYPPGVAVTFPKIFNAGSGYITYFVGNILITTIINTDLNYALIKTTCSILISLLSLGATLFSEVSFDHRMSYALHLKKNNPII